MILRSDPTPPPLPEIDPQNKLTVMLWFLIEIDVLLFKKKERIIKLI